GSHRPVAVQDRAEEIVPFALRPTPRPFDAGGPAESEERLARFEIPGLVLNGDSNNPQPVARREGSVFLGRGMVIRPSKARKVAGPPRVLADVLDDVFEANAPACGNQA